jgi:glycosyltransferase involved in cell wall biosynthesis
VIYPPVDVEAFDCNAPRENFYLFVGELTRYKRADLAVEACTRAGKRLIIIGEGPELRALKMIAGFTITFMGRQPFAVLREHYARCRALVFAGEEDFGNVIVEAMASGAPVIAFRKGDALETVVSGRTGVFFDEQTQEALLQGLEAFEGIEDLFQPDDIATHAAQFSKSVFKARFLDVLRDATAEKTPYNFESLSSRVVEERVRQMALQADPSYE